MDDRIEERRAWRAPRADGFPDEAELRLWARRLCVTPNELREMIEEEGDRFVLAPTP